MQRKKHGIIIGFIARFATNSLTWEIVPSTHYWNVFLEIMPLKYTIICYHWSVYVKFALTDHQGLIEHDPSLLESNE
jgi:hypothetical protein